MEKLTDDILRSKVRTRLLVKFKTLDNLSPLAVVQETLWTVRDSFRTGNLSTNDFTWPPELRSPPPARPADIDSDYLLADGFVGTSELGNMAVDTSRLILKNDHVAIVKGLPPANGVWQVAAIDGDWAMLKDPNIPNASPCVRPVEDLVRVALD